MSEPHEYPDVSDILAGKARGRRERAALSFAEKLAILDKLRESVAPIVRARQARAQKADAQDADLTRETQQELIERMLALHLAYPKTSRAQPASSGSK